MRTIQTKRLRLVPVTVRNANALWAILQSEELRRYQDLPSVSAVAFAALVAKRPRRLRRGAIGRFEWLIHQVPELQPLGWISLRIADRAPLGGEVGYSVLPEFRGRGIATEAALALLREAFERAQLERISAYCLPENVASLRVLTNLGFKPSGILPKGATLKGRPVDVLSHYILRDDAR